MGTHSIHPFISKAAKKAGNAFMAGRPYHDRPGYTTVLVWKKSGETRMICYGHVIARLTRDKVLWIYGPRELRIRHYKAVTMRQNWVLKTLTKPGYTVVRHGGGWFSLWNADKNKWHLVLDKGVYINLVAAKLGIINICYPQKGETYG